MVFHGAGVAVLVTGAAPSKDMANNRWGSVTTAAHTAAMDALMTQMLPECSVAEHAMYNVSTITCSSSKGIKCKCVIH